jgi:hypothetical protein
MDPDLPAAENRSVNESGGDTMEEHRQSFGGHAREQTREQRYSDSFSGSEKTMEALSGIYATSREDTDETLSDL